MTHRIHMYMKQHTCIKCECVLNDVNSYQYDIKNSHYICKTCKRKQAREMRMKNPSIYRERVNRYRRGVGYGPMEKNPSCSWYLGVHVAEHVLSMVFKDVHKMPYNHQGYDFICNKGMKIDVKSSTAHKKTNTSDWFGFHIRRNKIADYFLCLAFDSRENLEPKHLWLLPADKINHVVNAVISLNTINKWDEYKLPIDKVISCCDTMRTK